MTFTRYRGGSRGLTLSLAIGVAGLLLTALGWALEPAKALHSYLVAYCYWAGLMVAGLIMLATFHASHARWVVVFRRALEVIATGTVLLVPLFLPIAVGMKSLYVWVEPPETLGEHTLHLLHHKAGYLNVPFFLVRAAVYFAVWIGVSQLLARWSRQQDQHPGDVGLTLKQRRLGAGSLPALALTLTFAAVDWLMSLDPAWYSTIFGVYFFAGSFLAVLAVLVMLTALVREPNFFTDAVSDAHRHSLGKLLLAFVSFWAYIAFSQFLLIWIANLPEEVPWYLARTAGGWRWLGAALFLGHFLIPFLLLLSQRLKYRPKLLAGVAGWLLVVHYLDLYWVVMPAMHRGFAGPSWTDLTAFVGIGGLSAAYFVFRLRAAASVPVGDPYLADSLRYTQS